MIINNITELIHNTPLFELKKIYKRKGHLNGEMVLKQDVWFHQGNINLGHPLPESTTKLTSSTKSIMHSIRPTKIELYR